MNVLLVNLARMGDLVQMTPVMQGLKACCDARVSLLVTRNLEEFATLLEGVDEVLAFEEETLVPSVVNPGHDLVDAARNWRQWVERLRGRSFDLVVNLTHHGFATHLCSMLEAGIIRGRQRTANGSVVIHGAWLRMFFTALHNRRLNPLNLVDLYRLGTNPRLPAFPVKLTPNSSTREEVGELLHGMHEAVVALHPGANHPNRRWPAERFGELAVRLAAEGFAVVVLGGPTEVDLADEVVASSNGVAVSLAGRTSIVELPALLERVALLVTNDTGPLHVAAAVGTPTVSVFLAMARPEDTAPYAAGHLVFETLVDTHPCPENTSCPTPVCGSSVPVQAVLEAALHQVGRREKQLRAPDGDIGDYRLLQTGFDERGLLTLTELYRVGAETRGVEPSALLRDFWLDLLFDDAVSWNPLHARNAFPIHDRHILLEAAELGEAMRDRIHGRNVVDEFGNPATIASLEGEWLELEARSDRALAPLLFFRLEREWLYSLGFEVLRREVDERFGAWIDAVRRLVGVKQTAEVAP